jgi:hypothetical protein
MRPGSSRGLQFERRLIDRSTVIELEEAQDRPSVSRSVVLFAHGAAELVARRQLTPPDYPHWVIDPSSLPDGALPGRSGLPIAVAHLVPYRLALDVAHGGLAVAWLEPNLLLAPWLRLALRFEPVDYQNSPEVLSSTVGVLPTVDVGPFSLGAGPRFQWNWVGASGGELGGQVHLGFAQDRAGLDVGVRTFVARANDRGPWLVQLSLADLNGLAYWLLPWW